MTTRKRWGEDELELIWNLSEHSGKKFKHKEIAKVVNKRFDRNRTEISVRSAISRIRDGEYIQRGYVKFNIQERTDIFERVGYDPVKRKFIREEGSKPEKAVKNTRFVEDLPSWQQDVLDMAEQKTPYNKISTVLSEKYHISMNTNHISALVSAKRKRMREGKLSYRARHEEIESQEISIDKIEKSFEPWQAYIIKARADGKDLNEIRDGLKREYGMDKSCDSIRGHLAAMTKKRRANGSLEDKASKVAPVIMGGLAGKIGKFDSDYTKPHIEARERVVYDAIKEQARMLRQMDVTSGYKSLSLDQIMSLDDEERAKIAKVLQGPKTSSSNISEINLIAIPGFGEAKDNVGLVLPVFYSDVQTSGIGLSSMMYDVAIAAAHQKNFGIKPATDFQDRFFDLARLNLIANKVDYDAMAAFISSKISEGYGSKVEVGIIQDLPLYSFRLRGS